MNSEKFWDHFITLIPLIAIVSSVVILIGAVEISAYIEHVPVEAIFSPITPYCFLSHNGTVDHLSENDKMTFREPTSLCDISGVKNYTGSLYANENRTILVASYSYEYQMNLHANYTNFLVDCNPATINHLKFNNATRQWICDDGSLGREEQYEK